MSFLAPFFMLGAAAVALPILFHLIRRTPRGRRVFSSLMFVSPSPPRLTRRSRLDNLLLLLLRGLAILLLAAAFARPFLREAVNLSLDGVSGRRVVILLDTSASMQSSGVWQAARERLRAVIEDLGPADDAALYAFDTQVRPIVEFDPQPSLDPASRQELFETAMAEVKPSWRATDVGAALVEIADLLAVADDRDQQTSRAQIILISDLQQGASRDALGTIEWPEEIYVAIEAVESRAAGNAAVRLLTDEADGDSEPRIRVSNSADATTEQFEVFWATEDEQSEPADRMLVHVPPGQSRVVRLPKPDNLPDADRVQLGGDVQPFDDDFFVVPEEQEEFRVVYIGEDPADDPEGMLYFLAAALDQIPQSDVKLTTVPNDEEWDVSVEGRPRLVVATESSAGPRLDTLKRYVADGGVLLVVPSNRDAALQLVSFNPAVNVINEAEREDSIRYVMLGEIDFSHPVFADFAPADYSDFTKIHFWKHTQFTIGDPASVHVLARFDNGYPALWEQDYERGTLFVLASGWRLDDSQLALSSKFVPLLMGILEQAAGGRKVLPSYTVGDSVPVPTTGRPAATEVVSPDGARVVLETGAATFHDADQPGVYEFVRLETTPPERRPSDQDKENRGAAVSDREGEERSGKADDEISPRGSFISANAASAQRFAVNLSAAESDTTPIDPQQFEALGVRLGEQPTRAAEIDRQRQLRDIELESKQKLWQWLVVVGLGVLGIETWLAARRSSGRSANPGDAT